MYSQAQRDSGLGFDCGFFFIWKVLKEFECINLKYSEAANYFTDYYLLDL